MIDFEFCPTLVKRASKRIGNIIITLTIFIVSQSHHRTICAILSLDIDTEIECRVVTEHLEPAQPTLVIFLFPYLVVACSVIPDASHMIVGKSATQGSSSIEKRKVADNFCFELFFVTSSYRKVAFIFSRVCFFGVDIDCSTEGIAAIQGALRTAHHFDLLNIKKIAHVIMNERKRDTIKKYADRRVRFNFS